MQNVNFREERRIVGNMTPEELKEVIKDIPSEILIEEINARSEFAEKKINAISQVVMATR